MKLSNSAYSKEISEGLLEQLNEKGPNARIEDEDVVIFFTGDNEATIRSVFGTDEIATCHIERLYNVIKNDVSAPAYKAILTSPTAGQVDFILGYRFVKEGRMDSETQRMRNEGYER